MYKKFIQASAIFSLIFKNKQNKKSCIGHLAGRRAMPASMATRGEDGNKSEGTGNQWDRYMQ